MHRDHMTYGCGCGKRALVEDTRCRIGAGYTT
eukprot:CAMPEP_0175818418 /NCGR_PEP_ID=MMETSP0107_2-20121207/7542_1 /TAXON_ID=195067 ORGANISM="Goniomonas pacifica, Strain CCMP1869" /NCGR_SAMPLE_ID=MMETSP0107_2 /ASSEMBLY_ACC=CAM_ASM_000203 /LENGTH=31 /DNA_ID= /DNA_START= /DNA_END= /DNA_ORIENTATION=